MLRRPLQAGGVGKEEYGVEGFPFTPVQRDISGVGVAW